MKKHISLSMRIVLSLLAFMMTMQMSAESCSLHFSDITINPGGTAKMVVSYETDYENLTGFEFHFALPEGICMTTSSLSNALMQVCPSLTLEYNNQRDDVTIIMCYTFLEKLPSGKHDLMVLTFQADQNVAKQVYNIETTNNQFAYLGANSPNHMENQIFHITVGNQLIPIKRGDVNGDGGTTLQDILILVDYILADKPSVIDAQNYDIDGDGDVSLYDILIVVDIILNGGAEEQAYLTCPDDHHPHMIDLGLPSGTKWACCNVGATTPEGYGGYYAWGETEEKSDYSWETYIHCDGTQETCHDIGNDIAGTQYDVAHMKWGGNWVMPTNDQIQELFDNCTHEWKTINGIDGRLFTSQNGCVVFFPAAGDRWKEVFVGTDVSGYYWSSTRLPSSSFEAYVLGFYSILAGLIDNMRNYGMTIRPVAAPKPMDELSLSDETVDMFVNSTATVSIEYGSGEYELQNDNPDIIDAELILADKNENPNAKDEISIYGVAEGSATLTVLDKQNNNNTTVVVKVKTPTDQDVAITKNYVERVRDLINVQEEMPVDDFQNILLEWLEKQNWVKKSVLSPNKDLITITFENDVNFRIDFQDISFFDDVDTPNNAPVRSLQNSQLYYDVSYQKGEKILDNANILLIQGRDMELWRLGIFHFKDRSEEEYNRLIKVIETSPVNLQVDLSKYTLKTFTKKFSEYGMIFISQTHGFSNWKGGFQIQDNDWESSLLTPSLTIYKNEELIFQRKDNPIMFDIKPNLFLEFAYNANTIIHGAYCWSFYLSNSINWPTIVGYDTKSDYYWNVENLLCFADNMSKGNTCMNSMASMTGYFNTPYSFYVKPETNHSNPKQRYFSISTDDVTEYTQNGPVVTGTIKGYKNLKSEIQYYVYAFKGEKPNENNIVTKQLIDKSKIKVKDVNGTFSHEFTGLPVTEFPEEYQVVVGFEYEGITYYGPIKTLMTKGLCPDNHHPHMIDLGLPSGTKWACCNVGADKPEAYGGYYAWGETEEKSTYNWSTYQYYTDSNGDGYITSNEVTNLGSDIAGTRYDVAHMNVKWGGSWVMPSLDQIKELLNNCSTQWTTQNGVNGRLFTGPSGGTIFLPAAGYRWDDGLYFAGYYGYYWSSTRGPRYPHTTYRLYVDSSCARWEITDDHSYGRTVRPVSR